MSLEHDPMSQETRAPQPATGREDDSTEKMTAAFRAALSRMDADPQEAARIRELAAEAQETLKARESRGLDELRTLLRDEAPMVASASGLPPGERGESAARGIRQAGEGTGSLAAGDPSEIGGYRLLARLGRGGMAQVFLGESLDGQKVAVKVFRHEYTRDQDFQRRFAREVAAARRVYGVYTAPVLDADPEGEPPWMAADYVPGPSLADAVNEYGPLDAAAVSVLGAALAEGLRAIHDGGIIHRDLKPSNIIMAADGPRVIDFGIARAAETTPITTAGMAVGTPRYMSPEQLGAGDIGTPSDVFSLGAVLAFAATGRGPFDAPEDSAAIGRILTRPPDLSAIRPPLRDVIHACLAKDPRKRPALGELLAYFSPSGRLMASPSAAAHESAERQRAMPGTPRNQLAVLAGIARPDPDQSTTATDAAADVGRETAEFDVFLSYHREDRAAVRGIARQLRERGLHPWLDEDELPPGRAWEQALEDVIADVPAAAVIVGSRVGPWRDRELVAFLRQFIRRHGAIVPVLLPGATPRDLPAFLESLTWVDLNATEPDPIDNLVWGITGKHPSK